MTLYDIVAEYIEARSSRLAPRTVESYRYLLENFVPPFEASPKLLDQVFNDPWMIEHERTAQLLDRLICAACRQAYRWGEIDANPTLRTDRVRHRMEMRDYWSLEEARRFLQSERQSVYYCTWMLALGLGLRRGELLGARWRDIDGQVLHVCNQRYRVGGVLVDARPKTRTSDRLIPIPAHYLEVLRRYRLRSMQRPYICPCDSPEELRRVFRAACGRAGVRIITLHGLRHTFATCATNTGLSFKQVQAILGHAAMATTTDIYTHASLEEQYSGLGELGLHLTLNQGVPGSSP